MNSFKIGTIGLESRDRTLIGTTIDVAAGLEIGQWKMLDELDQAQVIVVNIDNPTDLNKALATATEMTIIVDYSTSQEAQSNANFSLQPPLAYKAITRLLKQLEAEIRKGPSKPAIPRATVSTTTSVTKTAAAKPIETVSEPILESEPPSKIESEVTDAAVSVEQQVEPEVQVEPEAEIKPKSNAFRPDSKIEEIDPVDIIKQKIDWFSDEDAQEESPEKLVEENIEDENPVLTSVVPVEEVSPTQEQSNNEDLKSDEELESTESLTSVFDMDTPSEDTFSADSRLIGLILNILESGETTQINHVDYPRLRIYPDNAWFIFTDELDSHPELFREPADNFTLQILDEEIKDELHGGNLPQSLWKLLFTAALFGSEGRLLESLDHEENFHLLHTPYFGMIPHTADHITISEFMVSNHASLETISNATEVDLETVIDFCNACESIQLLQRDNDESSINSALNSKHIDISILENDITLESTVRREPDNSKKTGLINSLWSNLTKTN